MPCSFRVGTSGATGSRSGLVMPMIFTFFASCSGMVTASGPTMKSSRPAAISCTAGPVPRNVTPVIEMPATFSSCRASNSVTEPEPTLP